MVCCSLPPSLARFLREQPQLAAELYLVVIEMMQDLSTHLQDVSHILAFGSSPVEMARN